MEETTPQSTITQFCVLQVSTTFFTAKVDIEMGLNKSLIDQFKPDVSKRSMRVTEENNLVDALNYMSSLGWEFVQELPPKVLFDRTSTERQYLLKYTFSR